MIVFANTMQTGISLMIRDDVGSFIACKTMVLPSILRAKEGEALGCLRSFVVGREFGVVSGCSGV